MSDEVRNEEMTEQQTNETAPSYYQTIEAFIQALPEDDRKVARDLLSSPDRFVKHLKVHREANAEARDRRLALEAIWRTIGLEPPSRSELVEVAEILNDLFEDGEFHPERYEELLAENEDLIIEAIENGEAEPEDFGLVLDEETGELIPEYELAEEEGEEEEYIPPEIEEELLEREERLAELERQARLNELKVLAIKHGVDPDKVDDFLKIYEDPEVPEDSGEEVSIDDLRKQAFEQYRQKYPFFFGGEMPQKGAVKTDNAPVPPTVPPNPTLEEAVQRGDVETALKNAPIIKQG